MNLPNSISLLRIGLVPVFMLLHVSGQSGAAMVVLGLCAASDVLDGALARRLNAVTELGKVLDPVADKLIQAAMMLCAAEMTPSIWLLLVLHLLRELLSGAMGLYVLHATGRVYAARWYGKLCTAFIYIVIGAALFWQSIPVRLLETGVLLCAVQMTLCLLLYMNGYLSALRRSFTEACIPESASSEGQTPEETEPRQAASTNPQESAGL